MSSHQQWHSIHRFAGVTRKLIKFGIPVLPYPNITSNWLFNQHSGLKPWSNMELSDSCFTSIAKSWSFRKAQQKKTQQTSHNHRVLKSLRIDIQPSGWEILQRSSHSCNILCMESGSPANNRCVFRANTLIHWRRFQSPPSTRVFLLGICLVWMLGKD